MNRRCVVLFASAVVFLFAADARSQTCQVDRDRELMIRNISVVEDCERTTWGPCPNGPANAAWTFGRLAEGLAGTTDPKTLSSFVLRWLSHWETPQLVNGHVVPARSTIRDMVIDPWLAASGGKVLDMKKAPLRLLAIVARLDLRQNPTYGQGNAGEARFVFGVLDLRFPPEQAPSFTVIVEYGLPAATCEEQKKWARLFHGLGSIPFGATYNATLQGITDRFTKIGSNPSKPNGSALNQLRTNEVELSFPWELREFALLPDTTNTPPVPLRQTTVKQTPDNTFNDTQIVGDFINEFEAQILAHQHVVPNVYQGQNFLGGSSFNNIDFWNGLGIHNNEARHLFSLNTCNACHGAETSTGFLQVGPRTPGNVAFISGFLGGEDGTGIDVTDPVDGKTVRHFNDLEFRAKDLCRLLQASCSVLSTDAPTNRVH